MLKDSQKARTISASGGLTYRWVDRAPRLCPRGYLAEVFRNAGKRQTGDSTWKKSWKWKSSIPTCVERGSNALREAHFSLWGAVKVRRSTRLNTLVGVDNHAREPPRRYFEQRLAFIPLKHTLARKVPFGIL